MNINQSNPQQTLLNHYNTFRHYFQCSEYERTINSTAKYA
nr:MAG TPA: hypothetical protein [Caudoviricetes sp.]